MGKDKSPGAPQDKSSQNNSLQKPVVVQDGVYKKRSESVLLLLFVAVLIIIAGLAIHSFSKKHNKPKPAASATSKLVSVCTYPGNIPLLKQAANALNTNNLSVQQQTMNQIKALSNFQKDPNCLYLVTSYYISAGDSANATKYFNELQAIDTNNFVFSSYIAQNLNTLASLKQRVDTLQQATNQIQSNAQIFAGGK